MKLDMSECLYIKNCAMRQLDIHKKILELNQDAFNLYYSSYNREKIIEDVYALEKLLEKVNKELD